MRGIIAVAVLGISGSIAMGADEYKIKMSRPYKEGDSVIVSTKVTFKGVQKIDMAGQVQEKKSEYTATLEGTETIDGVSGKGEATKLSIKVAKCMKDDAELIPADATITAENKEGRTEFKVDGKEPGDDVKEVLGELIDTAKKDAPSADDIMGTDKPEKVGDTWKVKSDVLAKAVSDGPIQLSGDQIKGECKLTSVSKVDDKESATVTTSISADVPDKDPNNGANLHDLKIKVDATQTMPTDETSHVSNNKETKVISFMMDTPGPVVTVSIDETKEEKFSEVKK